MATLHFPETPAPRCPDVSATIEIKTVTAMEDLFTVNFDLIYESPSKETNDKTFTVVPAEQTAFPRLQHITYSWFMFATSTDMFQHRWGKLTLAKLANVSMLSLLASVATSQNGITSMVPGPQVPLRQC